MDLTLAMDLISECKQFQSLKKLKKSSVEKSLVKGNQTKVLAENGQLKNVHKRRTFWITASNFAREQLITQGK